MGTKKSCSHGGFVPVLSGGISTFAQVSVREKGVGGETQLLTWISSNWTHTRDFHINLWYLCQFSSVSRRVFFNGRVSMSSTCCIISRTHRSAILRRLWRFCSFPTHGINLISRLILDQMVYNFAYYFIYYQRKYSIFSHIFFWHPWGTGRLFLHTDHAQRWFVSLSVLIRFSSSFF